MRQALPVPPGLRYWRAMDSKHPPEVIHVLSTRVACDGDEGPLGHPRVWLQMDASGQVDCGYCDRRFVLDGPGDAAH